MKTRLVALAGLAIGFALPVFAQQKEIDPQIKQAVEAHNKAYDTAFNKNDAAGIAALFAPDFIEVGPDGVLTGKEAVQARYAKLDAGTGRAGLCKRQTNTRSYPFAKGLNRHRTRPTRSIRL
jgi:hypothetical protein